MKDDYEILSDAWGKDLEIPEKINSPKPINGALAFKIKVIDFPPELNKAD